MGLVLGLGIRGLRLGLYFWYELGLGYIMVCDVTLVYVQLYLIAIFLFSKKVGSTCRKDEVPLLLFKFNWEPHASIFFAIFLEKKEVKIF